MIALVVVGAVLAVVVGVRVLILIVRSEREVEHVSAAWRDEHLRERRDDA